MVQFKNSDNKQSISIVGTTLAENILSYSTSWRGDWNRLTVFFDYPPEIRKVSYTTNPIESLNYSLRKVLKKRGAFPTNEAILKVLYLGMQRIAKKWTVPIPEWKHARNQFAMIVGDRVP